MLKPFLLILCIFSFSTAIIAGARANTDKPAIVVYDCVSQLKWDFKQPDVLRRHYDEVLLVTCLQAIVNRNEPRLFVRYNQAPDDFWFEKMREPGAWMSGRSVVRISGLDKLLAFFPNAAKGLVIWDERVPATSNVAATIAGVEDLLAVRYTTNADSVYKELTMGAHPMKVAKRLLIDDGKPLFTGTGNVPGTLIESSGSPKIDAYLWLLEHYIKTGKTNPRIIGYYIDAFWLKSWMNGDICLHTLNNLDYILMHRGVVCDLDVWDDETPVDDRNQALGADAKMLKQILRICYDAVGGKEMIGCFGFVPWAFKYTDFKTPQWDAGGKHGGVDTEWHMVELLSSYNVYMDADAISYSSLVNASFYEHYPLPEVIKQEPQPSREGLIKAGILDKDGKLLSINYYAHFQGDYDSAAWCYWQVPKMWNDPARGSLPLSWAMNPNIGDRFRFGLAYVRQSAKPGETWVAGEGAGYLMPANLRTPRPSGLPDGLQVWIDHNKRYYKQWDIHVTGFNIDGNTPIMDKIAFDAYRQFSPGGVGLQDGKGPGGARFGLIESVPFITNWGDLPGNEGNDNINTVTDIIRKEFSKGPQGSPKFHLFRSILKKPSFYAAIEHHLAEHPGTPAHKLVDIPTLMWLIKEYEANRALYIQ